MSDVIKNQESPIKIQESLPPGEHASRAILYSVFPIPCSVIPNSPPAPRRGEIVSDVIKIQKSPIKNQESIQPGAPASRAIPYSVFPIPCSVIPNSPPAPRRGEIILNKLLLLLFLSLLTPSLPAQSLDSLTASLRQDNPELRALALDYEAATNTAAQARQLPDLEISGGVFVLPIETRLGPQQFRVGATQMLPWPGKLAAMAELADARARPVLERAAARQLDLIYQLQTAYYRHLGLTAQMDALTGSLPLYAGLDKLALSRVENGLGSSVDVYRIQLQTRALQRRIEELDYQRGREAVTINQLLNRTENNPLTPPADLDERAAVALLQLAALPPRPDLANHPLLRTIERQQEISRQAIRVNDLDARPDFGVGVDYVATGRRTDADPPRNGRDVILPRAMMTIPLSRGKYGAKRREEELNIQAGDARRESVANQLRAEIERAAIAMTDAGDQLAFLVEQTTVLEAALGVARSEYANGRRPLDELLRMQDELVGYRVAADQARTKVLVEWARVRSMIE
ncbi:MAG: TolC family protein [Saprospiraceae bacterium]